MEEYSLAPDKESPSPTVKMLGNPKQPSNRLRSAVTIGAVVSGVFCILEGCIILRQPWIFNELCPLVQASAGFAIIAAILDVVIIIGVLLKDDKYLKYSLCATIAVHMVSLPLVFCTFFGLMINGTRQYGVAAGELHRFFICLVHMALTYCLLEQLRGESLDTSPSPSPPPPLEDKKGLLKKIMVFTGRTPPTADTSLVKLQTKQ